MHKSYKLKHNHAALNIKRKLGLIYKVGSSPKSRAVTYSKRPKASSTMPRGSVLTDVDKGKLLALNSTGASHRSIGKIVGRHRTTVQRLLSRPERRQKKRFKPRNKNLTDAGRRLLIREASKTGETAAVLKDRLGLVISVRLIQEILQETSFLQFNKMQREPLLTKEHRAARMDFARQQLIWNATKWRRVVFSDEKKFNLDGPDGLACYWHEIRKETNYFNTRQQGGDQIMVWGTISYYGAADLVRVKGNQDSVKYCQTLEYGLLSFAADMLGESWTFQQDNASIHRSKYTKKWLEEKHIDVMEWPSRSPDLIIIEYVSDFLARKVYANGRQFEELKILTDAVAKAWDAIDEDYLKKLYQSLPKRLVEVFGACTHY